MKKRHPIRIIVFVLLSALACNFSLSTPSTPSVKNGEATTDHAVVEGRQTVEFPDIGDPQSDGVVSGEDRDPTTPAATSIRPAPSPTSVQATATSAVPEIGSPAEATIAYFRSNVSTADPGETVTLEWSTGEGLTVTLWHLTPTGQFGRFWDVSASGAFDYTIDEQERNNTRFALFAAADADTSTMATLSIAIRCPDLWFLENEPDICPSGPAMSSAGAVQNFEGGTMIWVEEEDQIYVLFTDVGSPGWNRYVDAWDSGEPDSDPALLPPDGLYQPVRGFGLLWREEPSIRDRLGWAVDEEVGFPLLLQRTSYAKYNETYILAPDGGIWRLNPERSSWEKLEGP